MGSNQQHRQAAAPFRLICVVVDKIKLKARYTTPANPYHLGLEFGLERVHGFLQQQGEWAAAVNGSQSRIDPSVHVIVEMRGKNEDDELELEFRRICDGANYKNEKLNFEILFADKKSNSAGLQLADLVASPYRLVGVETRITKPCFRGGKIQAASKKWAGRGVGAEMFSVSQHFIKLP